MDSSYSTSGDVHVLPTSLRLPGAGVLTINAFVLLAEEPVLIDTGIGADADRFIDTLAAVVDPAALRWVWLTHDDADHTGALERVLELAPDAVLVTHPLAALRMAASWKLPLGRVHAIRAGDELRVGDRTLAAVAPPLFDNPTTVAVLDRASGTLFSADSFGALLPEPAQNAADVPADALAAGMAAWASFDSPWVRLADRQRYGQVLDAVRRIAPTQILSSHLPASGGIFLDRFLRLLGSLPDADPFVAPDHEAFQHIAAAITAAAA